MIFDPETSTFSSVGATIYPHKGAGCALFYSPKHKNRPTVFIGGSNDTSFDNRAEVLDYTVNNSIWEKRTYSAHIYEILFYYNSMIITSISLDCVWASCFYFIFLSASNSFDLVIKFKVRLKTCGIKNIISVIDLFLQFPKFPSPIENLASWQEPFQHQLRKEYSFFINQRHMN